MTFDLVDIAEGEPGRFWHMNNDCNVRVDTLFHWGRYFDNIMQYSTCKGCSAGCALGFDKHCESGLPLSVTTHVYANFHIIWKDLFTYANAHGTWKLPGNYM